MSVKPLPVCTYMCACCTIIILHANHAYIELAQGVVDAGAVPLLVLCLQEPELSLKRVSASALSEVAKHSPEVRPCH